MSEPSKGRGRPRFLGFEVTDQDRTLITQLTPEHQTILAQAGTMEQIADRLSISQGTAKSRLHRARSALTAARKAEQEKQDAR